MLTPAGLCCRQGGGALHPAVWAARVHDAEQRGVRGWVCVLGDPEAAADVARPPHGQLGASALARCKPVYITMPGFPSHSLTEWLGIAKKANDDGMGFKALPAAAQHYIKQLEVLVGVPCSSIGVGPDRDATIDRVD